MNDIKNKYGTFGRICIHPNATLNQLEWLICRWGFYPSYVALRHMHSMRVMMIITYSRRRRTMLIATTALSLVVNFYPHPPKPFFCLVCMPCLITVYMSASYVSLLFFLFLLSALALHVLVVLLFRGIDECMFCMDSDKCQDEYFLSLAVDE